jgi:histidine ammonia-lyase
MYAVAVQPSPRAEACDSMTLRIGQGPLDPRRTMDFISAAAKRLGAVIALTPEARRRIRAGAAFVARLAAEGAPVYGVTTGVGALKGAAIGAAALHDFQVNLIRSHCCGAGEELPRDLAMGMWVLLLNEAAKGHRGIRIETVDCILGALRGGMLACVPSRGSVGASGDLAPAAHAARALLGEGTCTLWRSGGAKRLTAAAALKRLGISPIVLGPKEGLALINGTHLTTAIALKVWREADTLLRTANLAAAMSALGARPTPTVTSIRILRSHRHEGSAVCAQDKQRWLEMPGRPLPERDHDQDPYCLRCVPQVHGAIWQELRDSERELAAEMDACTDNPQVFAEEQRLAYGGSFHAIHPARVSDRLASALAILAAISERRTNLLMNPQKTGLPQFLVKDGGFNSGFMMIQTTAAALASEAKALSFPASVDSIPTNCDQEDHVSMGPAAGLKALRVVENARYVLAIELICAAQAIEIRGAERRPPRIAAVLERIRRDVPYLERDRALAPDIEAAAALIQAEELVKLQHPAAAER